MNLLVKPEFCFFLKEGISQVINCVCVELREKEREKKREKEQEDLRESTERDRHTEKNQRKKETWVKRQHAAI